MKPELLANLHCLACGGELRYSLSVLACTSCGKAVPVERDIPLFTSPPPGLQPSEKLERGPESGTPWRQANWRFLEQQVASLDKDALILDVGAGRGDFAAVFAGRHCLALDVYPYPEVDLVCDLAQVNPLREAAFDAIALMNVLEHVEDTCALLNALSRLLKPGGRLIVAVPFLVKVHQAPVDFVRYTHFALQRLGEAHSLKVELLEGYYDPLFLLDESLGNLRWSVLPTLSPARRRLGRLLLAGVQNLARGQGAVVGKGKLLPPAQSRSQAAIGYHVVYRKLLTESGG
jgi:SAM-dependent methyltransferase